jgi:prophage antirepressor-like protein
MSGLPVPLQFEGRDVRVIDKDGEPWWVLADVCTVLEIGNPSQVASRLDDDEKNTLINNEGTPGNPNLTIISEPGLYKLLMTSRKSVAKRFDRWVRHEVLPQIRKTGSYGAQVPEVATQIIEGLKEALRPLAVRFDGQDQAIERVEDQVNDLGDKVDGLTNKMDRIEAKLSRTRRKITELTKCEHVSAINEMGGRCPCCSISQIVVDGEKSRFAEFDHFYENSKPDIEHTWLICKPCHCKLTRGQTPRDERESEFRAYQQKRRRLPHRQPRLF